MQDAVEHLVTQFENGTLNRKQLIQGLLAAVAPSSRLAHAHADTSPTSTFRGRSLNHVTLSVTDVERSQEFYSRLLGGRMSRRSIETDKGARVESATLALTDGFIALFKLGSLGCITFASVSRTFQSARLSTSCGANSRNRSRLSTGARNSTFTIPTGFWVRFPGWTMGSGTHSERRPTRAST